MSDIDLDAIIKFYESEYENPSIGRYEAREIAKEAIRQALEIAADKVSVKLIPGAIAAFEVDKSSITEVINLVK